jgi:hypothetical protein
MRELSVDAPELRALMPDDAAIARALVEQHRGGTRYASRVLEILDSALRFDDPEHMALLALDPASGEPRGLALFGAVAGALRVVKLHAVLGEELVILLALVDAVRHVAESSGERMIVCELPDDPAFVLVAEALGESEYLEEGRVPDFVRDGVALRLMVWRADA